MTDTTDTRGHTHDETLEPIRRTPLGTVIHFLLTVLVFTCGFSLLDSLGGDR